MCPSAHTVRRHLQRHFASSCRRAADICVIVSDQSYSISSYACPNLAATARLELLTFPVHVQSYGVVVPPGDEASLQYSFMPNKQLHPREFYVALTAFYSSPAGEASCRLSKLSFGSGRPPLCSCRNICLHVVQRKTSNGVRSSP